MRVCPQTIAASGEQRNETAEAMSSGTTRRPAGVRSTEPSISALFGKGSGAAGAPGRRPLARAEHLVVVRKVVERARVDDTARDGIRADPARRKLDCEIAH